MTILTILGAGNYAETSYVWGERTCRTNLFPAAVASWFPDATVKVVTTDTAWNIHGLALQKAIPCANRIRVPDGANEAELWAMFNALVDAVPEREEVVFDITHGFRSQPVIALLVAAFLRVAKGVTLKHVVYGAWEKDRENSPVFDLTPFVAMLDWASATERFLETGDARKLTPLITEQRQNPLNAVGAKLASLSEALALARPELAASAAEKLVQKIEAAKAEPWEPQHAPLELLLDRIESGFAPMADQEPLKAQWAQIDFLAKHGQYGAAAALAREWLVSVRVWKWEGQIYAPRDRGSEAADRAYKWRQDREVAERWLHTAGITETVKAPDEWSDVLKLWRQDPNIADLRNDVAHWGMRFKPDPPKTIRENVEVLPTRLAKAVKPLGLEVGGVS